MLRRPRRGPGLGLLHPELSPEQGPRAARSHPVSPRCLCFLPPVPSPLLPLAKNGCQRAFARGQLVTVLNVQVAEPSSRRLRPRGAETDKGTL